MILYFVVTNTHNSEVFFSKEQVESYLKNYIDSTVKIDVYEHNIPNIYMAIPYEDTKPSYSEKKMVKLQPEKLIIEMGLGVIQVGLKRLKLGYDDALDFITRGINTIKMVTEQESVEDLERHGFEEATKYTKQKSAWEEACASVKEPCDQHGSGVGSNSFIEVIGGEINDDNKVNLIVKQGYTLYTLDTQLEAVEIDGKKQIIIETIPTMDDINDKTIRSYNYLDEQNEVMRTLATKINK